jgi:hypothetical protein
LNELLRCPNSQDWFGGEGSLELVKSLLSERALDKQNVLLEKIVKWVADLGEVLDEALIEVGEANEALYFLEIFRDGPIDDSFNLDWVYKDSAMTDN